MRHTLILALMMCLQVRHVSAFSVGSVPSVGLTRSSVDVHSARKAAGGGSLKLTSSVGNCESGKTLLNLRRRGALAALSLLPAVLLPSLARSETSGEDVVVKGEMRLEEGADGKIKQFGDEKFTAVVTLRCVGKGIISETSQEVVFKDFPPPGRCMPSCFCMCKGRETI